MSNHGESINTPQTPLEQVRVALVIPHENSILVSPEYNSGLFVGERSGAHQSVEKAAHAIVGRHIGQRALSSVRSLLPYEDEGLFAHGYVVRPSHGAIFDPSELNLVVHRLDDYTPVDAIDQHFISHLL